PRHPEIAAMQGKKRHLPCSFKVGPSMSVPILKAPQHLHIA
ncbi:MAG: hypothetical protein ACI84R_001763, partial [Candidatus Azotimanducaceae bacterium]